MANIGPKHRTQLDEVNDKIQPKFLYKETLKAKLSYIADPVIRDEVDQQIINVRNQIIEILLKDIPAFFENTVNRWFSSFQEETWSYVHENLLEAVQRYNPNVKPFCKFTTFFWMYNQNILRNRIKQSRADKRDITKTESLDYIFPNDDGDREESSLDRFLVVEEAVEDRLNSHILLKKMYKRVSMKKKHVIKRLFLGYNQSEIAQKMNISGTNVSTAIRQIREECADLCN